MKYILFILDGISDHASEELGGKTPLEVSKIPNLHYLAKGGKVGSVLHVPDRMELTASVAALSVFGHNPKEHKIGLGPLEAANLEIKLEDNEVAFRMNLVTEADGTLADYTAGNISTKEAKALIGYLNKKLSSDFVKFFAGSGHGHVAVIKDAKGYEGLSARCTPPEQALGKKIDSSLPNGNGADMIKKLMYDAKLLLEQHEINKVRLDLGENPANMVWLWAQGTRPKLSKFSERFGSITGAAISSDDYMKGLVRLLGLTVVDMPPVSGDEVINYEPQAKEMLDVLKEKDFVCVHVKGCEQASMEGNLKRKISSLEAIDYYLVGAMKAYYEAEKEVRILITPLLASSWKNKAHLRESVPFIIVGKNVVPDEMERFSEATAKLSSIRLKDGYKLIDHLMSGKDLA